MKFGFCYIPDYHEEIHGNYSEWYRRLLREWRKADVLRYDSIWIAEHRVPGYGFCSTPVIAQALADHTTQIRIGTAVSILSHRHPLLTAEHWAAIDVLSGGRLDFGIGRGILGADFRALGIDSSESRSRFEEAWSIIKLLWTENEVSYKGRFWRIINHQLRPQPLQRPMPPTYVGAIATKESYRWAGANGLNLIVAPFLLTSLDKQRALIDVYREALEAAGFNSLDFDVLANYHLCVVQHDRELVGLDRYISRYVDFIQNYSDDSQRQLDSTEYGAWQSGVVGDLREIRTRRAIVGAPQQVIDCMAEVSRRSGITGWMFHVNFGGTPEQRVLEQMEIFAESVVPAFGREL